MGKKEKEQYSGKNVKWIIFSKNYVRTTCSEVKEIYVQ